MVRKIRRDNLRSRALHRGMDVSLNWLALLLAYVVKEGLSLGIPTEPLTTQVVVHTGVVVALIWLGVASALEVYTYKRPLFSEIVLLIATLAVTIAFFNTYVYFSRIFVYPRIAVGLYAVFGSALLASSRAIKHSVQRALHRRGYGMRRVLIIGTGPIARRLARSFRRNHALGYQFLGFVSEHPEQGKDVIGSLENLERILDDTHAEEVIVALPGDQHQRTLEIAERCQDRHLRLRIVPDVFDVVMIRATLTEIDDIPLIGLRDPVITGYQSVVKRVFDIAVALFCLILSLPAFIIIPILILIDSRGRGPIFFTQERVGENGKHFRMYKFRSMVPDAEERLSELVDLDNLPEPAFKIIDDPRVTRVGWWLRRTSLDELPQLINVLKGDMSMVGPRPEQVDVVRHYKLWHRKRLSIKPGLTGPMQVNGRGVLPLDERIKLELMYINQYSILEDLKYLLKTIPAVCRARGAY
ncbi:MAG TPA: sugar transferase [Phycisphaerae bacterium]|nr:sugar transferase [Phycisphaerae bacterium]HOJ74789.1 sugar transferase [Phycisphaerae bacterium]HOM51952.1 sugar transferase [Phycisphaerae bacterium]HON67495.1 sugar transferase [Phycisphaerae bacterium]HPP27424.1 sugar transferase [Phycisphaerae bacterium]